MLVFGDHETTVATADKLAQVASLVDAVVRLPPGLARHAGLVAALIEAGELQQGVEDARFATCGEDTAPDEGIAALLAVLATAVRRSWHADFQAELVLPGATELRFAGLPRDIRVRRPEGYAFYALYPEAVLTQAERLATQPGCVIGLRSIGTSLAAMVSAGLGPPALPTRHAVTLRPTGPPFARTLSVAAPLAAALTTHPRVAVVDEGPGLSGSSFGAVLDFLDRRGVAPERVHLFPGHAGAPGPHGSARHQALWARAHRHPASFEMLLLESGRLRRWAAELLGGDGVLEDVSGGAWRTHRRWNETVPPVHAGQERRKFLFRTARGTWLLKYVGLGRLGATQAARAAALAAAGFTPAVAGLCHGFLAQVWHGEARPLTLTPRNRADFLDHLGRYLALRAARLPATQSDGADAATLAAMARHNTAEALGATAAARLPSWDLPALERARHPVWTDNRLHGWEWLVVDGRVLKADAIDHAAAHDLVGCQDIAWDLAGATLEFALTPAEAVRLRHAAAALTGQPADAALIAFCGICYAAFQLGAFTMAAAATTDCERTRLAAAAAHYGGALERLLHAR